MKRGPAWGERSLIHVTLNTNDKQRFALVDENYSPQALSQLRESLPRVPGFPQWEIARTEPKAAALADESNGARPPYAESGEFWVSVRGEIVSRNRAQRVGENLVLETALLATSRKLSPEEASILADLEQCMAIVLLESQN